MDYQKKYNDLLQAVKSMREKQIGLQAKLSKLEFGIKCKSLSFTEILELEIEISTPNDYESIVDTHIRIMENSNYFTEHQINSDVVIPKNAILCQHH